MLRLDHLAISAATLEQGVAVTEEALGITLAGGGKHAHMATHNRLLNLGDVYLEVIAADPWAPAPSWPRWFDLDNFTGKPRLTNWIAACDDLETELDISPPGTGDPVDLARGELRWRMAVPRDGRLPFQGGFPALIQWGGPLHPSTLLPDVGVRLDQLEIAHPQAKKLQALMAPRLSDRRIVFVEGPEMAMQARFSTPHGRRDFR